MKHLSLIDQLDQLIKQGLSVHYSYGTRRSVGRSSLHFFPCQIAFAWIARTMTIEPPGSPEARVGVDNEAPFLD
jgi:hypothetical protein